MNYEQAVQQVRVQQQNVQEAQTNLGYATITSPIDGVVLSKEVEEGQTVASAMTTPTLFIIAQDLTDMRVIADIDEADIGGVKEGQRVTFTVDAFPDDIFEGAVTQVRQQATTESNVVTYEVVISAPNDQLKLKPGLTANVTIYTLEKNGVLAVPARALRFTPNEALLQEGETVEDVQAPFKVWTKEGNVFKAHKVEIGTSNGMLTEIVSGVKAGTEVLTDFEIIGGQEEEAEEKRISAICEILNEVEDISNNTNIVDYECIGDSYDNLKGPNGRLLRFDFAIFDSQKNVKCLIEYQGEQHYTKSNFGKEQREITDPIKRKYCRDNNIQLFEIKYT